MIERNFDENPARKSSWPGALISYAMQSTGGTVEDAPRQALPGPAIDDPFGPAHAGACRWRPSWTGSVTVLVHPRAFAVMAGAIEAAQGEQPVASPAIDREMVLHE